MKEFFGEKIQKGESNAGAAIKDDETKAGASNFHCVSESNWCIVSRRKRIRKIERF